MAPLLHRAVITISQSLARCTQNDHENEWVKKCLDYEVEGVRSRGRPKITRTEIVEKDCQTRQRCKEGAVDCKKWRKLTEDVV